MATIISGSTHPTAPLNGPNARGPQEQAPAGTEPMARPIVPREQSVRDYGRMAANDAAVLNAPGRPLPGAGNGEAVPLPAALGFDRRGLLDGYAQMVPNPGDPHGRIAIALHMYFHEENPQAAFQYLQNEFSRGDNPSAKAAFQELKLVHAMREYEGALMAGNREAQFEAVKKIAMLEEMMNRRNASMLDTLPNLDPQLKLAAETEAVRQANQRKEQTLGRVATALHGRTSQERAQARRDLIVMAEQNLEFGDEKLLKLERQLDRQGLLSDLHQELKKGDVAEIARLAKLLGETDTNRLEKRGEQYRQLAEMIAHPDPAVQSAARRRLGELVKREQEPAKFMTPEEFLRSLDQPHLVDKAREEAGKAEDKLHQDSLAPFDAVLDAKTPDERKAAYARFQQLRQDALDRFADDPLASAGLRLGTYVTLKEIAEAKTPAEKEAGLEQLRLLARQGSADAREALRAEVLPDGGELRNEMVARRALRGLNPDSKPADFQKSLAELEKMGDNPTARAWKPWLETHTVLSELENAKDPAARNAAMDKLVARSAGDPIARRALAGMLLADQEGLFSTWQTNGYTVVDGQPVFTPRNTSELQARAAEALIKSEKLDAGELSALAGWAARNPDKQVEERLAKALANPAEQAAATAGLADAVEVDPKATRVADILAKTPGFTREQASKLARAAGAGNTAAIRLAAGRVAETSDDFFQSTLLELARQPERLEETLNELKRKAESAEDKGVLLATLGRAVAESKKDDPEARELLRQGLAKGANPQSAAAGFVAVREFWNAEDVKALTQPPRKEVVWALVGGPRTLDKIPAEVQAQMRRGLIDGLGKYDGEQLKLAFRLLDEMSGSLTKDEIARLDQVARTSKDVATGAGRVLLQSLARHKDEGLRSELANLLMNREWGELTGGERLNKHEFRALIAYAQGNPDNLTLNDKISKQIYDLRLPRPPALVMRDMGLPQDDAGLIELAKLAGKSHSPQEIRNISERLALFNSLPGELREKLTGRSEAVDPRQVAMLLANGALRETDLHFLTDDSRLDAKVFELVAKNASNLVKIQDELRSTERRHQSVLETQLRETRKGLNWWERRPGQALEHIGNFFTGDSGTKVSRFEQAQSYRTEELRRLDGEADKLRRQLQGPALVDSALDFARDIAAYRRAVLDGDQRQADEMAMKLYGTYADQLERIAPDVWKELSAPPAAEGIANRNVWQRMKTQGRATFDRMPKPGRDADAVIKVMLEAADPYKLDSAPVRQSAINGLVQDEKYQEFLGGMSAVGKPLSELQAILSAGVEGTRYPNFVADARSRGRELASQLDSLKQQYQQNKAAIDGRITALQKVYDALPERHPSKREVGEMLEASKSFVELVTPGTKKNDSIQFLLKAITSDKFDDQTLSTWWKKNGAIEIAGLVAGALVATTVVVLSGGTAAPALVAILAASGTVAAREGMSEVVLRFDNNHKEFERTGSTVGQWIRDDAAIDWENQKLRPREFGRDVAAPLAKELAFEFVGQLGLASLGKAAFTSLAQKSFAEGLGKLFVGQAQQRMAQQVANKAVSSGVKAFAKKVFTEGVPALFKSKAAGSAMKPLTQEVKQELFALLADDFKLNSVELTEEKLMQMIATHKAQSALDAAIGAARGENSIAAAEFEGADLVVRYGGEMDEYLHSLKLNGCLVKEEKPGLYRVTNYDGAEFLVTTP